MQLHNFLRHACSFSLCWWLLTGPAHAQTTGKDITAAAQQFLQTLNDSARQQAVFAWDNEERFHWNFVPMPRKGLPIKAMNAQQKAAALRLLKTSTSAEGYRKATSIMAMENVLKALEDRAPDDHYRDPTNYYFSIFGAPGSGQQWGWRLEGHHVSLNFSANNNTLVAATPSFFGSNPGIVPSGPEKGRQILKQEVALAFTLLHSLTREQLQQAMIQTTAPREIITGNKRKAMLLDPPGLAYSQMNPEQQQMLQQLVAVYIDNNTKLMADILLKEVTTAGWNNMHFAWAGATEWGGGHYYRIQNPAILIEYDNTQNNGNHIHTVLRDLKNDFGEDVLREHYAAAHRSH
ncbi:MAG TPA: DUF3500 domain-containing protein [Chitinophaga sp.]|uniref:DUF3500 domain-containing protein n=1 Tax=Chitinophaga sp. TaxID=1869181 RepID=UPI002DB7D934|nr:DUF3500 domain-containing protein [Chitinophaga sp.]HEU4551183.1 DUF3500 domain-containing protein [Chitinophaga sp.]